MSLLEKKLSKRTLTDIYEGLNFIEQISVVAMLNDEAEEANVNVGEINQFT